LDVEYAFDVPANTDDGEINRNETMNQETVAKWQLLVNCKRKIKGWSCSKGTSITARAS
jgi:hypothetical protein